MPCTLAPWEIAVEERRANAETFQRELTDEALLEEVACSACRALSKAGKMKSAPKIVQKWWKLHKKRDRMRRTPRIES